MPQLRALCRLPINLGAAEANQYKARQAGGIMTDKLTPRQNKAIGCILTAKNLQAAATTADIPIRTIARWMTEPAFIAELQRRESEALAEVTRRLASHAGEAVYTISELLDFTYPPATRLRAAEVLLNQIAKLRELTSIEARLSELETAVYERG